MSAHVFLSHSTADKPVVEELARRLREKEGIQAWAATTASSESDIALKSYTKGSPFGQS
jgi:hypothetical protein